MRNLVKTRTNQKNVLVIIPSLLFRVYQGYCFRIFVSMCVCPDNISDNGSDKKTWKHGKEYK